MIEYLNYAVTWFINLGGTYFVPIVMLVIGLACKTGLAKSFKSALFIGIGLSGLSLIIDFSINAMQPVTEALSERFGSDFSILDIGYGMCSLAWSWPGVPLVILGVVAVNIILVSLKLTKTLWVDMWNIWHGQALGVMFWALTGSLTAGIIMGIGVLVLSMFLADFHAKEFQKFNDLKGITVPAPAATFAATYAFFAMKLINCIPLLKDVKASSTDIKDKFGIFGESSIIGAVLGAIMSLISGLSISQTIQISIQIAAVLVILPIMLQIVADGIIPITENLSVFMQSKFKNRELNIAVDPVLLLKDPSVMSTVVIMYPISLFIATIIPGNHFLPVASLAALPFWIGGIAPYTKGNIIHNVILTSIWIIPTTLAATYLAPLTTEANKLAGVLSNNGPINSWDEGGNLLMWGVTYLYNFLGFNG
ncbi:PTS transporter subunit IIC [Klebsiella pneumoniae]